MIERFGGRYQVECELGRGGMGVVYRCLDPNIGRTVAVKSVRLDVTDPGQVDEFKNRLIREVKTAGALRHPNIVTIHDSGIEDGNPYLVMEFVEGRGLDEALRDGMNVQQSLRVLRDAAGALDHAHANGVIHRDIKPSNILIARDGTVKLVDFGIAKVEGADSMTKPGTVLGSVAYMAPESLSAGKRSAASDRFSLAVMAYAMLTRIRPFQGEDAAAVIGAILFQEPRPASEVNPELPPEVNAVLALGLAKLPEGRYKSSTAFVDALYRACGSGATAPPPPVPDELLETTVPVGPRRTVNLLHLTDLHFGYDHDETARAQRAGALDPLCEVLASLEKDWKPQVVVISGDLTWQGKPAGYAELAEWLSKKVFPATGLTAGDCIVCPGNHDLDRKKARSLLKRTADPKDADEVLRPEELEDGFARPFHAFVKFAEEFGIPAPSLQGAPNYLVGTVEIRGVRFVCLNSAWFCRSSTTDRGQLWLGLPQLQAMQSAQLMDPERYDTAPPTVAVLHHPSDWLANAECNAYDRENTYRFLAERAHIILSGHTHGAIERSTRSYDRARLFVGGAAYDNHSYRNNFSILRIDMDGRSVSRRAWEFDPRHTAWEEKKSQFYSLRVGTTGPVQDPAKYLNWLRGQTESIKLEQLGLGPGECPPPAIDSLYFRSTTAGGGRRGDTPERAEPVALHERLRERKLVIEGKPGSGKTTFVRWVAWNLCRADGTPADFPVHGFPVWVRIRDLDPHIARTLEGAAQPGDPTHWADARWIPHFLASQKWGLDEAFFVRELNKPETVLLLDGLDEAANPTRRQRVVEMVQLAAARYGCHIVVTTRPGTNEGRSKLEGFGKAPIEDLNLAGIEGFLLQWCRWLKRGDEAAAQEHYAELRPAVAVRSIRILASNPLMLTALAVLHHKRHRLPEQRAQLYEQIMDWLADQAVDKHPDLWRKDDLLAQFGKLALAMQEWKDGRKTELGVDDAAGALTARDQPIDPARQFLEQAQQFSGIVTLHNNREITFWHLSFQEYLAARTLAGFPDAKLEARAKKFLYVPEGREVLQLLAGRMVGAARERLDVLFEKLTEDAAAQADLARQAHATGVLGNMLADLKPAVHPLPEYPLTKVAREKFGLLRESVMAIFQEGKTRHIGVKTRASAAEALDQASQSRLRTPDQEDYWVKIRGDTYPIGGDEQTFQSLPAQSVELPAFRIGKFPVTVWEYGAYLEDSGADQPEDWDDQAQHPSRPVTRVTWYDAQHYCEWASQKWDIRCKLATEEQWEAAARGTKGRIYPWGKEEPDEHRANFNMSVGQPTPVGMFPDGDTPEGVADMAGNVWEWTESDYDKENKVVRGASYYGVAVYLRAADRDRVEPGDSSTTSGFVASGSNFA